VKVGILALQGAIDAHARMLEAVGATPVEVRRPDQLDDVEALVLPGGESTTMSRLLGRNELFDPIAARLADGMPALGTCAGMILLASTVLDGRDDQRSFGALDIVVRRNAFGRQVDSFETDLQVHGLARRSMTPAPPGGAERADVVHAVFIRAPFVESVGPDVEVLAAVDGHPVLVRQGPVLATAFHPELSGDPRVHEALVGALSGGGP
jgi:5'-phosphate synthase pdxT subunit